jgi:hypothetical protein
MAVNVNPVGVPAWLGGDYVTVAASQAAQVISAGGGGAVGDLLCELIIIPITTAAASVSITDGSGSAITVFTGGGTLVDLKPFSVRFGPSGAKSTSGPWKVTTGANVSAIALGKFT